MIKTDQFVCLALFLCPCFSAAQPRSTSPYRRSDSTGVQVQNSGIFTRSSGEGLSPRHGVYAVESSESRFRSLYKISKDSREAEKADVASPREEAGSLNFREASQEELLAFMKERNRALWRALADAINQGSPGYTSQNSPVPSPYGHRRAAIPSRKAVIIPVKVLVNFPSPAHTGSPGPPRHTRGSRNNLWSQYVRNLGSNEWESGNKGNVEDLRGGLQQGSLPWTINLDTIPIAGGSPLKEASTGADLQAKRGRDVSQIRDTRTNAYPWENGGRDRESDLIHWTNRGSNEGTNTGPRVNQERNRGTYADTRANQGRNRKIHTDPWTNQSRKQGIRTFPRTNRGRNQGVNTDGWTNQGRNQGYRRGNQGVNTDGWTNQGRNQGYRRGNQGVNTDGWTNQGRNQRYRRGNQGVNTDGWTNQGRNQGYRRGNQGVNTDGLTNQGRNQQTNTNPGKKQETNQGTNLEPWTNQGENQRPQGRNQGANRYHWTDQGRNQRTKPDPRLNQGRNHRSYTYPRTNRARNQRIDTDRRRNQESNQATLQYRLGNVERNQETYRHSLTNKGKNQETNQNPLTNQGRSLGTNRYTLTNEGQNLGSGRYPFANDGRNRGIDVYLSTNQGENQDIDTSPWANQGRTQRTSTDLWINQQRNQGTNTELWVNLGRNPRSIAEAGKSLDVNSNLDSFPSIRQTSNTGTNTDPRARYRRTAGTSTGSGANQTENPGFWPNLNRYTDSDTGTKPNRNPRGEADPQPSTSDQSPNASLGLNPTANFYSGTKVNANQKGDVKETGNINQNYNGRSKQQYTRTQNDYENPNIKSVPANINTQKRSKNPYTKALFRGENPDSSPQEPNSQSQPQSQSAHSLLGKQSTNTLSEDEESDPSSSQNHSQQAQSNYSHLLALSYSPSLASVQRNDGASGLSPFGPGGALRRITPALPSSTGNPTRKSKSPFRPSNEDLWRQYNPYLLRNGKQNARGNTNTNTTENRGRNSKIKSSVVQNQRHQHRAPHVNKPVSGPFYAKLFSRRKRDVDQNHRYLALKSNPQPRGIVSAAAGARPQIHDRSVHHRFLSGSSSDLSKIAPFSTYWHRSPFTSAVAGKSSRDAPKSSPNSSHRLASVQSFASSEPHEGDDDSLTLVSRAASTGYYSRSPSRSPFNSPGDFYKPGYRETGYRYDRGYGGGGRDWYYRGQGVGPNGYSAVIKNGVTALLQIFNSSTSKGTTSTTKGADTDLSGSYFLYDPVTEQLSLVSGSGVDGVTNQVDTEGSYFEYSPSTKELKLVTDNENIFLFFTSSSNKNSSSNSSKNSNNTKSDSKKNNNDNIDLKGSYFQYNPSTGELKLITDTSVNSGKRRTNSILPHSGLRTKSSFRPFSLPGNEVIGVIQVDQQGNTGTSSNTNKNAGYIQFDPTSSQVPRAHGMENIQIVLEKDNRNSRNSNSNSHSIGNKAKDAKNSQKDQIIGFVVVDGGTASFANPNTGGYIQFNPAGTGSGPVRHGGSGPKRWAPSGWAGGTIYPQSGYPSPSRPLVKPSPDLFLRMFREGEIYVEGDAVVQNFYTDGDSRRMMHHFRALPLKDVRARSGFMTGNLKGYHVTACSACGPSMRPMIEFVTLHVTSPRIVRRFLYLPRKYGGNVGWASSSGPLAVPPKHHPRFLGTHPFRNQPQFGVPPFRDQMFDDFAAKRQTLNFARKRRD